MTRLRWLALVLGLGTAVAADAAAAQTVLVRVLSAETSAPLAGAIAHLVDDAGAIVASVLTDAQGRALFTAMPSARVRARAEMIGMSTRETAPFDVSARAPTVTELRLEARPVDLAAIDVSAARRACSPRPAEEGRELAVVWDEARKALTAAALTERQGLHRYETMTFQRDVLADGTTSRTETRQQATRRVPFETLAPADLVAGGFVRRVLTEVVYHAPDANVLLSAEFTDAHCFRLVAGPPGVEIVGIGFEPLERRRDVVDIAGTLWLDRGTAELRWLDYAYVNLDLPVRAEAGGRVTFQRTPSGRWIVPDWWIDMPILAGRRSGDGSPRVELAGTRRSGGQVLEVLEGGGRAVDGFGPQGGVEGIVVDSAGYPVAGVRVGVAGGSQEVFTDSLGAFRLMGLSGGTYDVWFEDPRAAIHGLMPPPVSRRVLPGEVSTLELYMPTVSELLRDVCRGRAASGGASLAGRVVDAGGRPLAGVIVRASWAAPRPAGPPDPEPRGISIRRRIEAATLADGTYTLCDLPRGTPLDVSTIVDGSEVAAGTSIVGATEAGALRELSRADVVPPSGAN
ncbi:MAG: carboxypeptidase-like regulatory domain-containing protein [Gemmatimonadales bacterium]